MNGVGESFDIIEGSFFIRGFEMRVEKWLKYNLMTHIIDIESDKSYN